MRQVEAADAKDTVPEEDVIKDAPVPDDDVDRDCFDRYEVRLRLLSNPLLPPVGPTKQVSKLFFLTRENTVFI